MINWKETKNISNLNKATDLGTKNMKGLTFRPDTSKNRLEVVKNAKQKNLEYQMRAVDQHISRMKRA